MKKGRSSYSFQMKGNIDKAEQLMQSYIKANGFKQIEKKGEKFYRGGDIMVEGYRYFDYKISGNELTVYAWLKGGLGDIGIEQGGIANINLSIMNYRKSLSTLFKEIEKLNAEDNEDTANASNEETIEGEANINQMKEETQNNRNEFAETFENETIKKQEKLCEIGFWLSIIGVVLSVLGITYGVIIYILNFYFASQGLKTKKRGKAIATIVLSIISIFIIICEIILISAEYV